jgi:hypothetical protein
MATALFGCSGSDGTANTDAPSGTVTDTRDGQAAETGTTEVAADVLLAADAAPDAVIPPDAAPADR